MAINLSSIQEACSEAIVQASIGFEPEKLKAWEQAIKRETEKNSKWVLEMMLENAATAHEKKLPLCDDTGIPYVQVEVGDNADIGGNISSVISAVELGVSDGLRRLPGRPMAVKGTDLERITQENGLYEDSGMLIPSPIRFKSVKGSRLKISVLLQGGGPEIRARTFRVFHHHDFEVFSSEVSEWAVEMAKLLGCTPCIPAVGVGRTHYEANCFMLDAMTYGKFGKQNEFEQLITDKINSSFTGPLGIGGNVTAIQTFSQIGPQRASGVRIVSLRVGCMVDPRRFSIIID